MNSYYSNRIEGQSTHPVNIDRALNKDFSAEPAIAQRQRIAIAHIDAEIELEKILTSEAQALSSKFLQQARTSLYGRLSKKDRTTENKRVVAPGVWRSEDVTVFRHHPPSWTSVPAFVARADQVYSKQWGLDSLQLAIACAHHRLVWTHPLCRYWPAAGCT